MNDYLVLKWLHILSSMLLFGTGIGSAFYVLFTSLTRDVRAVATVTRLVVIADWYFTAPTVIFQPWSGVWLSRLAGFPMNQGWLLHSMVLYTVAIACWLPVVWIQLRLRDQAANAAASGQPLSPTYWRYLAAWSALGTVAFLALMVILYAMVMKWD